ncbi:MAG TPA: glycosyltransferase [Planctomycetaceae bacterium]|nr:glycosyltransferase [Planctomycetaceae bacterium]
MDGLLIACWCLAGLALFQAALTLLQTWDHYRYHRTRLAAEIPLTDRPRVMLFVPCKGLELGLEEQLAAFFTQDYTNYEVCFIVEAEDDPALALIETVRRQFSGVPSHVVVAGLADDSGQKVHNLVTATSLFAGEFDVFAFSDSDARPIPTWLGTMVGRMAATRPIVTGYRWMVPQRPTFANRLVSALSNQLAGVAGPGVSNLVWGGSWLIRGEAFRRLGLPEAWRGTLSDDLTISRLARRAGMKVIYEPRCLVPSPVDMSLAAAFEFIRRQYLIVRVYTPGWWWLATIAAGIPVLVYSGSAALAAAAAATGGAWWIPAGTAVGYYAASVLKSSLRWNGIRPFVRVTDREYRMTTAFETLASPLAAAVTLAALVLATLSRRLTWRGITYRLDSATRTRIERRDRPAPPSTASHTPLEVPPAQRAA